MTTQTEPSYHYILTLQGQSTPGVVRMVTAHNVITPPEGWTRADIYEVIVDEVTKSAGLTTPYTLFFTLEQNQI